MARNLITTNKLSGKKVIGGKKGTSRIGKVRSCVFHPKEKRCVGFVVKRPDLALMFHRKDLFVPIGGFELVDGNIVIGDTSEASGKRACKSLGIDWESCVLWVGLPIMTEDGKDFGVVGNVTIDLDTGVVDSLEVSTGMTNNALLGTRTIPASMIKGFRMGIGAALAQTGEEGDELGDDVVLGAILVSDEAQEIRIEGGIAEKAGKTTAVVADKVSTTYNKAKPTLSNAAKKTGEVVNKGAYVTGRQIGRSKGMFAEFKEEYDKGRGLKPDKPQSTVAAKGTTTVRKTVVAKPNGTKTTATKTTKTVPANSATAKKAATNAAPAEQKNMFESFMDEYKKARYSDD